VEVKFTDFKFDKKFDKSAFDMQANMNGAPGAGSAGSADNDSQASEDQDNAAGGQANGGDNASQQPQATQPGDEGAAGAADGTDGEQAAGSQTDGTDSTAGAAADEDQSAALTEFIAIEPDPDALPEGVSLHDHQDLTDPVGVLTGVMYRYAGTYDFTIVETTQKDDAVAAMEGRGFDLGFTVGNLSGVDTQTLTWTYDGVEYRLTTANLPEEDMVKIAQSMVASSGK